TLMNLIGLLDRPSTGTIVIDGHQVDGLSDDELANLRNSLIGFIFQSFHLLPRLSVIDNVALPLMYRGMGRNQRREIAASRLAEVGLADR
ncbi:ATP-binding cassette domain-containing protein, partial [Salmonella enterica]|uniref:ATP-binding cassette domain-containing protein n=1 Tax=Salmonella enterica TaxID=28901 RepID=UPI003CF9E410